MYGLRSTFLCAGLIQDGYVFVFQAKQKASVAWIVQKAHKNKVPSDIEDPYYKDYEVSCHLRYIFLIVSKSNPGYIFPIALYGN